MNPHNVIDDVIANVKSCSANAIAEIMYADEKSQGFTIRNEKVEKIEKSSTKSLGLRVIIGQKQAFSSISDLSADTIKELAEKTVTMAENSMADEFLITAEESKYATQPQNFDLYDDSEINDQTLINDAIACESLALQNKSISNSDSSYAGQSKSRSILATSKGFHCEENSSSYSIYLSLIAGAGEDMQTDYSYSSSSHYRDLNSPQEVSLEAQKRTIDKLNPRKFPSKKLPIIFDNRNARSLVKTIAGAISGISIVKNSSFLAKKLNQQILPSNINIIDNPHLQRGMASSYIDDEFLPTNMKHIVENGILKNLLLDLRTANQLKMSSNGSAARGLASAPYPSATNMYLENGTISYKDLIKNLEEGIIVTEMFSTGTNMTTGDYSKGIGGFYVKNGEIQFPINEVTIASNLLDMFKNIIAANDMELRKHTINSPSLLIEQMTVACNE